MRQKPATFFLRGDGITLERSAGTGYSQDSVRDNPDLGIVYMIGRCHRYEGNRLYRSANPVIEIGGPGGEDVRITGNRTFENGAGARFVKVNASSTTYGLEVSQIAGDDFDQLVQEVSPVVGLITWEKSAPWTAEPLASTAAVAAPMAEATSAQLASITAAINTTGKYKGKLCFVTDTNGFVAAAGSSATASWRYSDGTIAYDP